MKKIITLAATLAATLALAVTTSAAQAKFYSAAEILERMQSSNQAAKMLAMGYAVAVFDVGVGRAWCNTPSDLRTGQVAAIARSYLIRRPDLHDGPADRAIILAFVDAFGICDDGQAM